MRVNIRTVSQDGFADDSGGSTTVGEVPLSRLYSVPSKSGCHWKWKPKDVGSASLALLWCVSNYRNAC
jgi:hypothetical protein